MRIRQLQRLCDDVVALAGSLRDEVGTLSELAYSKLPGPESVKAKGTGEVDVTGDQAVHGERIKSAVAAVAAGVEHAHRSLVRAERMRLRAIDIADAYEDLRDPDGTYGRPMQEPEISKRELREARMYAAKRNGNRPPLY